MKMRFANRFALLVFWGGTLGFGQSDFSKQTVEAVHVEGWGLADVMRQVADRTHLTVGVELDVVMAKAGHFELDFPGGTVADLASKSAALMQGASWKIVRNRSLLIYLPGKATSLSSVRLQSHGVAGATRRQTWVDLPNHPEIDDWLHKNECKREEIFVGDFSRGDRPTISVPGGTITLGDMIETASSESALHFWSILEDSHEGQCLISISF
jgi:hypothetical protein